jgi:hypothetical protein
MNFMFGDGPHISDNRSEDRYNSGSMPILSLIALLA